MGHSNIQSTEQFLKMEQERSLIYIKLFNKYMVPLKGMHVLYTKESCKCHMQPPFQTEGGRFLQFHHR